MRLFEPDSYIVNCKFFDNCKITSHMCILFHIWTKCYFKMFLSFKTPCEWISAIFLNLVKYITCIFGCYIKNTIDPYRNIAMYLGCDFGWKNASTSLLVSFTSSSMSITPLLDDDDEEEEDDGGS